MPKFQHDCSACRYLGHLEEHDLYYCPMEPTVVARFGDEGPEYASGLPFANAPLAELPEDQGPGSGSIRRLLRVAWLMAVDAGVLTLDPKKAEIWHPKR